LVTEASLYDLKPDSVIDLTWREAAGVGVRCWVAEVVEAWVAGRRRAPEGEGGASFSPGGEEEEVEEEEEEDDEEVEAARLRTMRGERG